MMSDKKAKMHELFDEAISPEAEVINFKALHDLLEAQIEYQSDESISGGTASTAGEFSGHASSAAAAHLSDRQTGAIPSKISDSLTGWITKATCCEDFNKKLFGSHDGSLTASRRASGKEEVGDLSGRVETLDDKLDDFVSDTSRRVSKINKRVKKLEKPNPKKIEWDQDL